jgi:hypothetical protein
LDEHVPVSIKRSPRLAGGNASIKSARGQFLQIEQEGQIETGATGKIAVG